VIVFDYKAARRKEQPTEIVAECAGEAVGGGWYVILTNEMVVAVETTPDSMSDSPIWIEKAPRKHSSKLSSSRTSN
jgi:hypothetical protein